MTGNDGKSAGPTPASSPCMLHELTSDGRLQVDPQQIKDVARWRKSARERLLSERNALTELYRTSQTHAITCALDDILSATRASTIGLYWPMRNEPDLRSWMGDLALCGMRMALPVATDLRQPLIYREWSPGGRLARGLWNIPFPADGAEITPEIVIAPLVGFDMACYRLGYGGGFFDRTLATMHPRPLAVGVGFPSAAIPTIYPQPHDIPMDWIVSGDLPSWQRKPR